MLVLWNGTVCTLYYIENTVLITDWEAILSAHFQDRCQRRETPVHM